MTNGEQSFGAMLWLAIGSTAAVWCVSEIWWLVAAGWGLGLYPTLLLCNAFSQIEKRENHQQRCRRRRR